MVQSWMNSDNLYLKFGPDKTTAVKGGEFHIAPDGVHAVTFTVDLTTLTETETPLSDVVMIPAGVFIKEVEVLTQTAAATGVAIDLGFVKNSDRSTEVDFDGLLAAFPTASMNAPGEKVTVIDGQGQDGALIGTTLASTSLVTCSRTTATAFTTGKVRITIRFLKAS